MSNKVAKKQMTLRENLRLRKDEVDLLRKKVREIIPRIKGKNSKDLDSLAEEIAGCIFTSYQMRNFKERRGNRRPSREVQHQIKSAATSCNNRWMLLEALAEDDISYAFDFESAKVGNAFDDIDSAIRGFKVLESHLQGILQQLKKSVGRPSALTQKTLATKLQNILIEHAIPVTEGRRRNSRLEPLGEHSVYEQIYNGVSNLLGFDPLLRPAQNLPKKSKSKR
jgi:hypothetical protein